MFPGAPRVPVLGRNASGRTLARMGSDEKHYERRAADAVGRALGRNLRRYEDESDGDDSLDYIDDLNEVYGMKLVTPEE